LRALLQCGELELPRPGAGATAERFRRLRHLAATEDLSVGRLAEAHCDAVAILAEGGRQLPDGALAGVWASRYGGRGLRASPVGGRWRVYGELAFCSGAEILDVALVDAAVDDRMQLFAIQLDGDGIDADTTSWRTAALAATGTGRVHLDVLVDDAATVGERDFYLRRPGFWHGAIGVAACWLGAAEAIRATTIRHTDGAKPHAVANLGRATAAVVGMRMLLGAAGAEIDARPARVDATRALIVRHLVATGCRDVIEASQRATGPGPLVFDATHAQRVADLRLYIEQQHHETDLEAIGHEQLGA
jgi:hypothetical protein